MSKLSIFQDGLPEPCPETFNAAEYVLAAADRYPEKPALEVYRAADAVPDIWTYDALRNATRATAGGLQDLGIVRGDRILLRIGNSPDFPILFLGALSLGAIPVPTSPSLTQLEFQRIIDELSPRLICFGENLSLETDAAIPELGPDGLANLRQSTPVDPVACGPEDLAYMIYTSGTSGNPRAVMHAHRAVWARRMMRQGWTGLGEPDRLLHAGAFNWTYTLGTGLLDPWSVGATSMIYTGVSDSPGQTHEGQNPIIFCI